MDNRGKTGDAILAMARSGPNAHDGFGYRRYLRAIRAGGLSQLMSGQ
jgi:hypothetical protein